MKKNYELETTCPNCHATFKSTYELEVEAPVLPAPESTAEAIPETRAKLEPDSQIFVYKITSEQIKQFIIDKTKCLCPDVKVEVAPVYIERKSRNDSNKRIAYASIRIAFSDKVIDHGREYGYYGRLGESEENTRMIRSMFTDIYQKYHFSSEELDVYLNSYKNMEALEENFGISEEYLRDLRRFANPSKMKDANGDWWVFFSGSAEKIITDMLAKPVENSAKYSGRISIEDVFQVSKDNVEFLVYLYPDTDVPEDPRVRQILLKQGHNKK